MLSTQKRNTKTGEKKNTYRHRGTTTQRDWRKRNGTQRKYISECFSFSEKLASKDNAARINSLNIELNFQWKFSVNDFSSFQFRFEVMRNMMNIKSLVMGLKE